MKKISFCSLLFVLLTLTVPLATKADVSPSGYHWASTPVYWYHNNSTLPSNWRSAIKSARSTWTATAARIGFTSNGDTTRGANGSDYKNVWTSQNDGAGNLARVYYSVNSSSELVDVDGVINTYYSWSTTGSSTAYDVQNVMTHEWGHWLHIWDDEAWQLWDYDNTMYAQSGLGETKKRSLTSEDIDGIMAIYP